MIPSVTELLVPSLVPVLLGGLVGAVTSIFTTTKRLRSDILADVELAKALPSERERERLNEDIGRRYRMLFASRYRIVEPRQVALLTALIAFLFFARQILVLPDGAVGPISSNVRAMLAIAFIGMALLAEALFSSDALYAMAQRAKYLRETVDVGIAISYYEVAYAPLLAFKAAVTGFAFLALLPMQLTPDSWWESAAGIAIPLVYLVWTVTPRPRCSPGGKGWREEGAEIRNLLKSGQGSQGSKFEAWFWGPRSGPVQLREDGGPGPQTQGDGV